MSATTVAAFPLGPLDPERSELLLRVVEGLEPSTLQWLAGFAAGVAHERAANRGGLPATAPVPAARPEAAARLTIVYGSQTGNGKRIAERLGRAAEAAGIAARVYSSVNYPLKDLPKERLLVVVVSTQGDGDPPDDARGFLEFLASRRAPRLEQLSYSVLALGDSSYPKFCETGKQVDERLATLGAKRLLDRVDCDVDYDTLATPWLDRVVTTARDNLGAVPQVATVTRLRAAPAAPLYSREQPFAAEVLANQRITARGATKDVRHVELALEGSGLTYTPGDALGVWHENPAPVVADVLEALRLDGAQDVEIDGQAKPLRAWLTASRELTRLTRPFLVQQAERSQDPALAAVLQPGHEQELRRTLKDLQVVDVLQRHRGEWDAKSFVQALRPLAPRLYSIASSPEAVGDEVHVTVAVVEYKHERQRRLGAASAYLAGLTGEAARARVFIEHNERFRLPADTARDVIMIGPGTGVAPFRGFVQHREAQGATGRNWLFFGARHFQSEFLYQAEWQEAVRKGVLSRLDVAFSRDRSTPRTYVQDRLRAAGKDVYAWLEGGAYLYVCGDAEQMAPDVQGALVDIVAEHGAKNRDAAEAYVRALADERRYLRDVY
jgi:sulfite reductase (NADPH) flavoprotein alpha-component